MAQDLSDHPFSRENIRRESSAYINRSDAAWERWTALAERLFGHDLDGNDPNFSEGVGYSIDEAYIYFTNGSTPQVYVSNVRMRKRYAAHRLAQARAERAVRNSLLALKGE